MGFPQVVRGYYFKIKRFNQHNLSNITVKIKILPWPSWHNCYDNKVIDTNHVISQRLFSLIETPPKYKLKKGLLLKKRFSNPKLFKTTL